MDKEFKRKSDAVFEALGVIVKAEPGMVFLGGSAIQAILEKPRRLSIDLDLSSSHDAKLPVNALQDAGFTITPRKSRNPIFELYKATKGDVEIKLDISRFSISGAEHRSIYNLRVLTPKKHYFLAAKLSSLALGTIGRLEQEPIQVVKDIFDINCLLDAHIGISGMATDWSAIVSEQNTLWNTSFGEEDCTKSTQRTLLNCLQMTSEAFIPKTTLKTFEDHLVSGQLLRREFVVMSARALLLLAQMNDGFYQLEAQISEDAKQKKIIDKTETELFGAGVLSQTQLHDLKINAPKTILYMKYWLETSRHSQAASPKPPLIR